MSKQFTVITKDGSKWLRPVRDCIEAQDYIDEVIDNAFGVSDVPYIGNHPEGTAVYESEVREVRQFTIGGTIDMDDTIIEHGDWITMHDFDKARLEADLPDFLKRNAYTDAESHNRNISDNPRYPLFSHMSSEHGLTLLDSELDEIAHHAAPMTGVDYWKRRCQAAEKYIGQTPCDHDITPKQIEAHEAWQEIIEEGRAYGN